MKTSLNRCVVLLLVQLSFLTLVGLPRTHQVQAALVPRIITHEGREIASVFDELKPNPSMPSFLLRQTLLREDFLQTRKLIPKGERIGGSTNACLLKTQGASCPPNTVCAGHFMRIVPLPPGSGCNDPVACPTVANAVSDPNRTFSEGEKDTYCGGTCGCCLDAEECDNP